MRSLPRWFVVALVWLASGEASVGWACTPCAAILDFDASAQQAELIVVGHRIDFSEGERTDWQHLQGPDTIHVKVLRVLKGKSSEQELTVNSWDGMCSYGIVVDDKPYVMLLQRRGPIYDAVNFGCSFTILAVTDGEVEVDGHKVSLDSLADRWRKAQSE